MSYHWGKRLGLGRLAYLGWHRPRGFAKHVAREGAVNLWLASRGRAAMRRAARRLPPVPASLDPSDSAVHFLTGSKFWDQTLFCARSLLRHAGTQLRIVLVDDGTLSASETSVLRDRLPGVELVGADDVQARLDKSLPASRYPVLRARRVVYPHLRKLTDIHAGLIGWKLVLDSDMLFFRRPDFLLGWLPAPDRPLFLRDAEPSYGYSAGLMAELAGSPVPEMLNVGACGLNGGSIDWDRLEDWCRVMLEREGSSYLQEQALSAMLAARSRAAVAPAADYVVMPSRDETRQPTAALHHYVAGSKAWYFRYGWRVAL